MFIIFAKSSMQEPRSPAIENRIYNGKDHFWIGYNVITFNLFSSIAIGHNENTVTLRSNSGVPSADYLDVYMINRLSIEKGVYYENHYRYNAYYTNGSTGKQIVISFDEWDEGYKLNDVIVGSESYRDNIENPFQKIIIENVLAFTRAYRESLTNLTN